MNYDIKIFNASHFKFQNNLDVKKEESHWIKKTISGKELISQNFKWIKKCQICDRYFYLLEDQKTTICSCSCGKNNKTISTKKKKKNLYFYCYGCREKKHPANMVKVLFYYNPNITENESNNNIFEKKNSYKLYCNRLCAYKNIQR